LKTILIHSGFGVSDMPSTRRRVFVAIAAVVLTAPSVRGQARTGLLVVAHGANAAWNARVRATVAQVKWDGPVAVAFLMGEEADSASWDAGIREIVNRGADQIVAVPLMVSSHGAHYRQIRYLAGEIPEWPADLAHQHGARTDPVVPVRVTGALDGAPELGLVLRDRWRDLSPADRGRPLLLVAHGPSTDAEAALWIRDLERAAEEFGGDPGVRIGLLRDDASPPVRAAAIALLHETVTRMAGRGKDSVAVLPVLISSGRIDRSTIPKDLTGLPVSYTAVALTPHPALARWIERVALAKAEAPQ
jgi:sirohydrochlorin ferrochelatase